MKRILQIFIIILFSSVIFSLEKKDFSLILNFDKTTYRMNSPLNIEIKIVNISEKPKIIKLSPLNYESFYFIVKTPENETLEYRDEYKLKIKEIESSYDVIKEVKLFPDESISRKIDLTEIFDFRNDGYYYLKVLFYPDPDLKSFFLESENYKFLLKPPDIVELKIKEENYERKLNIESARKLPPYDVIDNLLDAKMKKDWDRFLMHFDVERLIYSFQNYGKAYENARKGKHKLEILEDFKKFLTTHWQDRILSYKILESYVKPEEATVDADVEYKVRELGYVLRYKFKLYKNSMNEWKIYDYIVLRVK